MSLETKNKKAIRADFSPYRYEVNEGRHFLTKKSQNQPIRGQIPPGIQLQTLPSKCNTRKLRSKTWDTAEKKLFPILEAITLFNTIK